MKYKVFFKGSQCKIPGYRAEGLSASRYAFRSTLTVDTSGGLVTLDVYPLNTKSRIALESAYPVISRYHKYYRPLDFGPCNSLYHRSKHRHKMWSVEPGSEHRFWSTTTLSDGTKRYRIDLDHVDTRLLDENYSLAWASDGQYSQHPRNLPNYRRISIAFRIALTCCGDENDRSYRPIFASLPTYLLVEDVAAGSYGEITEITYEEFAERHRRFIDD